MQQEMERRQTELSTAQGTIRYHVHRLYICFSRWFWVSQDGAVVISTFSPQETRGAVEGDAGGEGRVGGSTTRAARDDDQVCQLAAIRISRGHSMEYKTSFQRDVKRY